VYRSQTLIRWGDQPNLKKQQNTNTMKPYILNFGNYDEFRKELKDIAANNPGVSFLYKLFSKKDGTKIPVSRIAGTDNEGILYIGQTTSLVDRLALLHRSFQKAPLKEKLWQHGADEIYWQCESVRTQYPIKQMVIEITLCDDSKNMEYDEISKYCRQFGEVPPFNGAIVKR